MTGDLDHIPREAIIAEFSDYDVLIERLRDRMETIGAPYRVIEELAGLGEGNLTKYLSTTRAKNFTMSSMLAISKALAIKGIFIEDKKQRVAMQPFWEKRDGSKAHTERSVSLGPVTLKRVLPSVAAEMGRRGGRAWVANTTPEQRRIAARRAVRARWSRK